jgi:hypothetical protein
MCTHEFGAYTGDQVVLSGGDREMVATLVDMSAAIQGEYSNCTDEKIKEKLAMERHTTRRSSDQLVFCSSGDTKEWKTTVERGLVISLAKVWQLWSDKEFLWDHIEITSMFPEALPYHSTIMTKGHRFEIYMQAFRVINKETFLEQAELLYSAMPKKSEAGWETVKAMFAALLAGKSSYYDGRSIKGGFWRYWGTKGAAVGKEGRAAEDQRAQLWRPGVLAGLVLTKHSVVGTVDVSYAASTIDVSYAAGTIDVSYAASTIDVSYATTSSTSIKAVLHANVFVPWAANPRLGRS